MSFELKRRGPLALGLIGAAIAGLGVLQALLQVASGHEFSIPELAFWIGATAIAVYMGIFWAMVIGGSLIGGAGWLLGDDKVTETFEHSVIILCGLIALGIAILVMTGGVFKYEHTSTTGRALIGFIGIITFAAGILALRRMAKSSS